MSEALTHQQLITAALSVVAIVISVVSLRRTTRLQEQQLRLMKKQEELTDLQLEALRKQAGAAEASSRTIPAVDWTKEKADVRVDLLGMGHNRKFVITNWGRAPARDVSFELEVPAGQDSPMVKSEYEAKIPITKLLPGSRATLTAAFTFGMAPAFPARWSWKNPDGTEESRSAILTL